MKSYLIIAFSFLFLTACSDLASIEAIDNGSEQNSGAADGTILPVPIPGMPIGNDSVSFISMDWDGKHKDASLWNQWTYDSLSSLGEELVDSNPSDVKGFCPNYNNLNREGRVMFWIHLMSVMTRYESGFDPSVSFKEAFNDSRGRPVISRGLLQISFESGRGYDCPLGNEEDLHDSEINLECGVRILHRWVVRDGVISQKVGSRWRGGARYWAVLRNSKVQQIKNRTKTSEVCQ